MIGKHCLKEYTEKLDRANRNIKNKQTLIQVSSGKIKTGKEAHKEISCQNVTQTDIEINRQRHREIKRAIDRQPEIAAFYDRVE